jgi:acetyl esterase/lipase
VTAPPVLDRSARRFLDALNGAARDRAGELTISDLRRATVELAKFAENAPAVERADDAIDLGARSLRLRLYSPAGRAEDTLPGLVYFHGGGLVAGDLDTHDALTATIAAGAGCRVIAVDYRLAPEARFPAARDDAIAAALAVARNPERFLIDPARIAIGGDSAGGQLAALAARAGLEAGARLALQFLLCPVMDSLAQAPSRFALERGYLIDEATMRAYWDAYRVEGLDPRDPRVAPLAAGDFAGLPPTLIHVAQGDPLHDEGVAYAAALSRAGVEAKLTRHAGLIHHFYGLGAVIPAARTALAGIVEELAAAFAAMR